MKSCTPIHLDMERKLSYDTYLCSFEGVLCISLQKFVDMDNYLDAYHKSLTLHFAYGYICNCSTCSRASGLLHRNKHYIIMILSHEVHRHIFTFSKQTFNEALDFCNFARDPKYS